MFNFKPKTIIITTVKKRKGYGAVFVAPFPILTAPWSFDNDRTRYYISVKSISNTTIQWEGSEDALWALNER